MAEAICGPSNALQAFKKHTSVDRTLQQDRFASRSSPLQGFRSSPAPGAGSVDAEFEAFAAGHPAFAEPAFAQRPHSAFQSASPAPFAQPLAASDWASDFQRLQLHSPATFAPHAASPAAWHQDFMRQQSVPSPSQVHDNQPMYRQPLRTPYQSQPFPVYNDVLPSMALDKGKEVVRNNDFDSEAFERAFAAHDEAFAGPKQGDSVVEDHIMLQSDYMSAEEMRNRINELHQDYRDERDPDFDTSQSALPFDIQDPREEPQVDKQEQSQINDEDLAATAAELLDRVSDNTSRKFQESSFLALMRKLRDGDVRVEGDQMVDSATGENVDKVEDVAMNEENERFYEQARHKGLIGPDSRPLTPQSFDYIEEPATHKTRIAPTESLDVYEMSGALQSPEPRRREDDVLAYHTDHLAHRGGECTCPFHLSPAGKDGKAHTLAAGVDTGPGLMP